MSPSFNETTAQCCKEQAPPLTKCGERSGRQRTKCSTDDRSWWGGGYSPCRLMQPLKYQILGRCFFFSQITPMSNFARAISPDFVAPAAHSPNAGLSVGGVCGLQLGPPALLLFVWRGGGRENVYMTTMEVPRVHVINCRPEVHPAGSKKEHHSHVAGTFKRVDGHTTRTTTTTTTTTTTRMRDGFRIEGSASVEHDIRNATNQQKLFLLRVLCILSRPYVRRIDKTQY